MSRIVFLLGAGASRGRRKTDSRLPLLEKDENNIIEGLPLVVEIPDRINFVIKQIEAFVFSTEMKNTILSAHYGGADEIRKKLIEDLHWLQKESARHATIDTFAKKLYLTKKNKEFYKVEMLLAIFFIIEQVINKPDGRYDSFLANILDRYIQIPSNIGILTWNYDSQFEIAYKEYFGYSYNDQRYNLNEYDVKGDFNSHFIPDNPQIIKINGTANFRDTVKITSYDSLNEELLVELLKRYIRFFEERNVEAYTNLSFAWDNPYLDSNTWGRILPVINDSETLVIIVYKFHFFNRDTDREIFQHMTNLRKVYIQDPNAENLIKNIEPVMMANLSMRNPTIEPIKNVDQFFLPPEL